MDCSLPGSSVHGILQVGVLEWVAIFFSSGSSWPKDQTQVLCIAGRFFTVWATWQALTLGLIGLEKLPGPLCVNSNFPTGSHWLICLCPRCLCRYRLFWLWDYPDTHSGTLGIGLGQRRERISGADSASPQMLPHRKLHSLISSCLLSTQCLPDSQATCNTGQKSMQPISKKQTKQSQCHGEGDNSLAAPSVQRSP